MNFDVIQALHGLGAGMVDPCIERELVQLPEAAAARANLWGLIHSGELLKLDDPLSPVARDESEHERQGFINGFRLGMKLAGEVSNLDTPSPAAGCLPGKNDQEGGSKHDQLHTRAAP